MWDAQKQEASFGLLLLSVKAAARHGELFGDIKNGAHTSSLRHLASSHAPECFFFVHETHIQVEYHHNFKFTCTADACTGVCELLAATSHESVHVSLFCYVYSRVVSVYGAMCARTMLLCVPYRRCTVAGVTQGANTRSVAGAGGWRSLKRPALVVREASMKLKTTL